MSQDIISTKYHDPRIQSIIQKTEQLNDKYPVLLMPLRLETRYMTIDRPVQPPVEFDYTILYDLVQLEYLAERMAMLGEIELQEAEDLLGSFIGLSQSLISRFNHPKPLPYPENTWWDKHMGAIGLAAQRFTANFSGLSFRSSSEQGRYNTLRDSFMSQLQLVEGLEIRTVKNTDFDETSQLIDWLNNLDDVLEDLGHKSMSYTSSNKESLFTYIDGRINYALSLAGTIEETMGKNLLANTTQINRIDDFPSIYSNRLSRIQTNLNTISSEYKRAEYTNRLQFELKPRIDEIVDEIREVLLPKLNYTKKLKTVFVQELNYQACVIEFELEMLLYKGITSYGQLSVERVKLYKLLRKFRASGHDIVFGTENEIYQLRNRWSRVDILLNRYVTEVSKLHGANSYERAGIARSMSHINENYRADLDGFKKSAAITEPFIRNNDFLESAKSYEILMGKTRDIASYAYTLAHKTVISKDDLDEAYTLFTEYEGESNVLCTKTTIIPEEYYKAFHSSFSGFRQSVTQIAGNVQGQSSLAQAMEAVNDTMQLIEASVSELSSDITDEKDPFYDDFRKKFIFALPTETRRELWVRIYPDELFIHSHEKAITQEEYDDTATFWTEVWNAGGYKDTELAAWRTLALKHGVNRAIYLRQLLDPAKAQQSASRPNRPSLSLKAELESNSAHFTNLMDLDLTSADALNEIQMINSSLNAALNIQMGFQQEQTLLLNDLVAVLREVQLQVNSMITLVNSVPVNERSLMGDFIIVFNDVIERVNLLSDELSQKIPVDVSADLPFWTVPNIPQTGVKYKDTAWSEAPSTNTLPERFVFVGIQEKAFSHLVVGNPVPGPLIVGLNPGDTDIETFSYDDIGNLSVDENIKWMTDFDEAVEKGMGIIVPLTKESMAIPFDKIMVLGLKDTSPGNAKVLLEELMQGHIYSPDGLSLLPLGTPTNITEKKTSGFSSEDDEDKAYMRITGDALFTLEQDMKKITDGQRLLESLGLSYDLLSKVENTERRDIYKALFMNKAMWASTMGYYMEEVMDTVFTLDNFNRTREYFINYVSGRGYLPAIRIGSQPYGILPTTAFSRFRTEPNEFLDPLSSDHFKNMSKSQLEIRLQKRFDIRLKNLLNSIREQWMLIVERENLNIHDFDPTQITSQEHFMQLLGLQPTSIEQYYRYNINSAQRRMSLPSKETETTVNFRDEDFFGYKNLDAIFGNFVKEGYFIDDTYFEMNNIDRIEEARIFRLRYLEDFSQLVGPFVREGDEKFLKKVQGKTYIDKILSHTPYHLWQEIYGDVASNSLFFLFLRQSLAAAYRNTALDILMEEGLINENTRRRAGTKGTYILPTTSGDVAITKWNYLFSNAGFFEGMMQASPYKKFPLQQYPVSNSFWDFLKGKNWSMSQYLYSVTKEIGRVQPFSSKHDVDGLTELRQMYYEMRHIRIDELERLFAEHLDLCTYRFDAWQLGIANKRLSEQRSAPGGQDGIHLGAYGWLEGLEPGGERKISSDVPPQLRENDGIPVYTDKDNEGFIHAPSINHAMTAAILRAGYIANKGSGDQSNPMAVNLTSRRVRMALNLLEGIKNGQEAGALLGYQLERGLHEGYTSEGLELDTYIYDLRRKFPLSPDVDTQNAPDPDEERNVLNVVHGMDLLEAVRTVLGDLVYTDASLYELQMDPANKTNVLTRLGLGTGIPTKDAKAIFKEIDRMADAYDALGDLLLSESVYHIAQGNYVRSAAVFAALSEGRVPREVQIINTPRTGHVLTQRMILQLQCLSAEGMLPYGGLSGSARDANILAAKPVNWQDIDFSPRAFAEPSMNNWLGTILGDPEKIRCFASCEDEGNTEYRAVSLKDLNLQAIDVVYMIGNSKDEFSFELNAFVANYLRKTFDYGASVKLSLFFKERNEHLLKTGEIMSQDIITFNEIMPLLSSLFDVISGTRHTAADDYVVPGQHVPADQDLQQYDLVELRARFDYLHDSFSQACDDLRSVFQAKSIDSKDPAAVSGAIYSAAEISAIRAYLYQCQRFGVPGCIPDTAIETDSDAGKAVAALAPEAIRYMEKRLSAAEGLANFTAETPLSSQVEKLLDATKALLGKVFVIIPHFSLRNYDAIHEVLHLPADQGILRNAEEYAMEGWIQGIAKVRRKINRLEMASTMTELFNNSFPEPVPLQFPCEEVENEAGELVRDYWMGLEFPESWEPENDKLSLVVLGEANLVAGNPDDMRCGLLLDDWIEVIPNREEDTGITFNYDQPDAEPPQSMLLAVTPVETGKWDWNDLVYTLVDTMDLYKARLVEPEQIDTSIFTQVLPAVMGEMAAPTKYQGTGTNPGVLDLAVNNIVDDQ